MPYLPYLVDTHCHLTDLSDEEVSQVIARAAEAGIEKLICIGASKLDTSAPRAVQLSERFPTIWCSVGIHPHDAGAFARLPQHVKELATHRRVVAIGETGLDFFRDWAPVASQESLFRDSIQLALLVKKPLIIHCREALEETIKILQEEQAAQVGGVFHCYSGDAAFAARLQAINFLVSFPGNLTFKKAEGIRAAAKGIPLTQIMLETDSPYMAPEPFRGGPSESRHVREIALKLAEVKGLPLEEVANTTTNNARLLFKLAD